MNLKVRSYLKGVWDCIHDDLQSDPLLRYILLLAVFVSGFWFWWRIPNFATSDEYRRIGQPMKLGRFLFTDSVADSISHAAQEGVGRDATTYLHGLVLLPLFLAVVLLGELETLISVSGAESTFALWNAVPAWFWTAALVITRLLNVVLVVGAVYVTYRIGTVIMDRQAGRIAAVFTTLSLAVIQTAHEVNEDTPALFLLLVVLYLSIRYTQTNNNHYFLAGCALGGLAIAFKLTAGVAVIFLGTAYILSAAQKSGSVSALWQPRLLGYGLVLGVVIIYVGIPNLLLRGPDWLIESRIIGSQAPKTAANNIPLGYSALLAYLNGLGILLAAGTTVGLLATVKRIGKKNYHSGELIVFVGLAVYLLVFVGLWDQFRTHHVLPSIPLLIILFGCTVSRHLENPTNILRGLLAVMLLTTMLYAGAGLYAYTDDPRDDAAEWIESETQPEDAVTIFENSPAHVGLVHGRPVDHYTFGRAADFPDEPYTEWLISTPDRDPEYIQTTGVIRDSEQHPRRAKFIDRLIYGDQYGYVVAAEFGERSKAQSRRAEVLQAGIDPRIEKRSEYIVIFSKNGSLARERRVHNHSGYFIRQYQPLFSDNTHYLGKLA